MKKKKAPYPKSFAKRLTWRIMLTLLVVMGFTSIAITMTSESVSKLFCTEICTSGLWETAICSFRAEAGCTR